MLIRDNIFGAWLYSFENQSWIVVSQEKIQCWIFSDLGRPSTWFKSLTAHFYLKPLFNALNMLSALRLTYFNCTGTGCLDDVKKHTHTFSSTKLLTWATVADKLVLVNSFWWNNHFFYCSMRCLLAISSWFVQRASLTVNIELSDVTKWYYNTVPYGLGIWEKESTIGVQWFQKNPNPWVHRSVGNSASLVSHWNGRPSGWDFSVPTEHQWWILFISHIHTNPWER